jgi:hypothetical protein
MFPHLWFLVFRRWQEFVPLLPNPWHLARSKASVVNDRRDRMPVMFTADGVYEGALELFHSNLQQPNTC